MRRSRLLPFVLALFVLSLALMGCGLVTTTTRLLVGPTATPLSRIVEKVVVATPTPAPRALVPAVPTAGAPAAPAAPVAGSSGSDIETEILKTVYQKVNPSVVYIENLTQVQGASDALPEGSGSGFVWDAQGHIVTNDHVVRGADKLQVVFSDDISVPATLVGADPDSDLAVIKVDPKLVKLVPVEQGNIDEVKVGQRAIAIGNPFGEELRGTMTSGIISAIGRSIPAITGFSIPNSIQTDAAINPGNSGGPLLNDRGQVIGVNAQIQSSTRSNAGVGFAIPISSVQRVVPALIREGKYRHAFLGISMQTYSPAWAEALGFPVAVRGAYIASLTENGPAARAGLRAGSRDTNILLGMSTRGGIYLQSGGDLVTAIDNQPITRSDDILIYMERFKSPGDEVKLTVLRPGEGQKVITFKLAERPSRVK
jgi:2-alkenal reductase